MFFLILTVVVISLYARTFNYGLVIDDFPLNFKAKTRNIFKILYWNTFKLDRGYWEISHRHEHMITTAIHLLNVLLMYMAFGHNNIGFLAALLFAVNPSNNQGSIWLSGRGYAIATTCILLSIVCFPLFPIFYTGSMLFSISPVLAPLLFIMLKPHWMVLLLPITLFLMRNNPKVKNIAQRKSLSTEKMRTFDKYKLLLIPKTLAYYTLLALFPVRNAMFHEYMGTYGLSDKECSVWEKFDFRFFLGIFIMIGMLAMLIFIPHSPITFGLFWYVLFLSQWSNFILINHAIAERYVYLANVGLMFALANVLVLFPSLAVGFVVFYATLLWKFMPCYKDNTSYFKHNIDMFPNVAMAWNQLGLEYMNSQQVGSAVDIWRMGLIRRPNDFRLNYNLACTMNNVGQFQASLQHLEVAERDLVDLPHNNMWRENIAKVRDANMAGLSQTLPPPKNRG